MKKPEKSGRKYKNKPECMLIDYFSNWKKPLLVVYVQALVLIKTKSVSVRGRPTSFRKAEKTDATFEKQTYVPVLAKKDIF